MTDWQTMDSAPRDGSEFQAWMVTDAGVGFWEPRARFEPVNGGFEIWGRTDYDTDGWELVYMTFAPSHWMPQPSPPTA